MQVWRHLPSFIDPYNPSMSSLCCKALCIGISFLVLSYIFFLNSSLVYFKNIPVYLIRWTVKMLILLMRFLLPSLVSISFIVCLRYSFALFCLRLFDEVYYNHYYYYYYYYYYLLLASFSHQFQLMVFHWSLSDGKYPQVSRTRLSILSVLIFLYQIPSQRPDCKFSMRVFGFPVIFHFLQVVWCRRCTLGDWSFPTIY